MKDLRFLLVILIAAVATTMSGCYYDSIPSPGEIDREVSFTQDVIPIFNQNCNSSGCHNTGGIKPDLSSEKALTSLDNEFVNKNDPKSSLLYRVLTGEATQMPPTGKMNAENINIILAWIEQGAQNN